MASGVSNATANLSPTLASQPEKRSAKRLSIAPPGYHYLKVRKPDGTIVTVQRRIAEDNASPPLSPSTIPFPSSPGSPESVSPSIPFQENMSPGSPVGGASGMERNSSLQDKRKSRLRDSMIKGLGGAVIGEMPAVEVGDWHPDDKIVDHEDDLSDDEFGHDEENSQGERDEQAPATGLQSVRSENEKDTEAQAVYSQGDTKGPLPNDAANEAGQAMANATDLMRNKSADGVKTVPLKHHWATLPYWGIVAVILLPLFFFLLGIFIIRMDGKSVNSTWHRMEDVIKIGVSAYQIAFSVVIAQLFKSIAVFRLERGVKLVRIEQLVGSNSFGRAIQQPFLLRRLDLLTVLIVAAWCLSPLGSQALQRVYTKQQRVLSDQPAIHFLNTNNQNEMFSYGVNTSSDEIDYQTKLQLVSVYYNAAFLPPTERDSRAGIVDQDRYGNPGISKAHLNTTDTRYLLTSAYGIPLNMPNTTFDSTQTTEQGGTPSQDRIDFVMSASYYNLTCGDWSLKPYSLIKSNMTVSNSSEFAICMTDEAGLDAKSNITSSFRPNFLAFGSLNRDIDPATSANASGAPADNALYSYIECTYDRVFVNVTVRCERDTSSLISTLPLCQDLGSTVTSIQKPANATDRWLRDFTREWIDGTTSTSANFITSTTEKFVDGGLILDDPFNRGVNYSIFNLSNTASVQDFEWYMSYAFNTWVNLGYCPECIDFNSTGWLPSLPDRPPLYVNSTANRMSWDIFVYKTDRGWVVAYMICCLTIFIASVVSIILEAISVAPDIFGSASSLARESRYLHLPKTSSAMNVVDRARMVGGVEVMIQDVNADADVGRIAWGIKHDGARKLEANRLYR